MKLKLTLAQAAAIPFVEGIIKLDNLPVTGDEAVLLDRARDKIIEEHKRFHKLRNGWIEKHGDKAGEGKFGIPNGDPRIQKLLKYEGEVGGQSFEVRIVKKIKLPQEFQITAAQYRALKDTGFVEEIAVPEEDEENEKSSGDLDSKSVDDAIAAPIAKPSTKKGSK